MPDRLPRDEYERRAVFSGRKVRRQGIGRTLGEERSADLLAFAQNLHLSGFEVYAPSSEPTELAEPAASGEEHLKQRAVAKLLRCAFRERFEESREVFDLHPTHGLLADLGENDRVGRRDVQLQAGHTVSEQSA